jgi:hypothetical protein
MKRFVVAYMDFFDNNLTQEIVEAETEVDARWCHSKTNAGSAWGDSQASLRKETDALNAEAFQHWCFDSDFLLSVMEI